MRQILLLAIALLMAPAAAGAQTEASAHPAGASAPAALDAAATFAPITGVAPIDRGGFAAVADARLIPGSIGEAAPDTVDADPFDLRVARFARSEGLHRSFGIRAVARIFDTAAVPGTFLLAAGLYARGRLGGDEGVERLGFDIGESIAIAGAAAATGKVLVGRARPHTSPAHPMDVRLGRGVLGDRYQSFPSAHTAAAFATATVLASDLPEDHGVGAAWLAPALYAGATLAGVARIFHDEHWATDVLGGALVGIAAGLVAAQ